MVGRSGGEGRLGRRLELDRHEAREGHELKAAVAVLADEELELIQVVDRFDGELALLIAADHLGQEHRGMVRPRADGYARR